MRVKPNDLECSSHLLFAGPAADVQEVGRLPAEMLDDVHRRHRKARAVYQAGDVAVELDVIQVVFAGFGFQRRFFGQIAHGLDVRMPKKRIIIQRELCVHGQQRFFSLVGHHDAQRIDFDK